MIGKALAIGFVLLYLLLFLVCASLSATLFLIAGCSEFAALGAAVLGVAAVYTVKKIRRVNPLDSLLLVPLSAKTVCLVVALSVPATLLVQSLQLFVPAVLIQSPQFSLPLSPLEVITITLTTPVMEELFFRGCMLKALQEQFHPVAAVSIVSILFSGLHSGALWSLMALLISIFYSILFIKYKSLYAPIAAHITSNVIAVGFNALAS